MTSSGSRHSVLPALTAALAGALVAGFATVLTGPIPTSTDGSEVSLAGPDALVPDPRGLARPNLPVPSEPATTSPSAPPTSSTPPTSSSVTSSAPAPPPPPEPPPEPPATTPDPPAGGAERDQVVSYVNQVRERRGCDPVQVDGRLTDAAQRHSSDMSDRDYFSHTTPEGVTFDERIRDAGYPSPGAENLARGARSAEDVMEMWMRSEGHRANILNCRLSTIGVGLDTDGWYWTQDFGY